MSETHTTVDPAAHAGEHSPYLKVFFALLVFTLVEYFYAGIFKNSFTTLVLGLMFWAVLKATLVGWYFMHLKFEGKWVYSLLVPAGILGIIFVFALLPDIGFSPIPDEGTAEDEASALAPLDPGIIRA